MAISEIRNLALKLVRKSGTTTHYARVIGLKLDIMARLDDNNITDSNSIEIQAETPYSASSTSSTVEIEFLQTVREQRNSLDIELIPGLLHGDCGCNFPKKKEKLDEIDRDLLAGAEELITNCWDTFCEVGMALNDIKEFELYREKYPSFADYCKDKLKMHIYKD